MHIDEVRAMCLWLRKIIPAQNFDDDTPEAWTPLLAKIDREDARAACMAVIEREQWITPRLICEEVKRIRARRLAAVGFDAICPNVNPDDWQAYKAERAALRDTIAAGRFTADDRAAYEAGGIRLTPGEPHRPLGHMDNPRDARALIAGAGRPTA